MFGIRRRRSRGEIIRTELGESWDHLIRAAGHAADGVAATAGPRVSAAQAYAAPAVSRIRRTASNGWSTAVMALAPLVAGEAAERNGAGQRADQVHTVTRKARSQEMRMRGMRNMMRMSGRRTGRSMRMPGRRTGRLMLMRRTGTQRRLPRMALLLGGAAAMGMMIMRRRRQRQQWQEYDPGHMAHQQAPEGMGAAGGYGVSQVPGPGMSGKPSTTSVVAEERGPQGMHKIGEERAPQSPRK
ncbi:MAG TPA: hypothetical protein VF174_02345 [Micromonosporaceae bacterium]